MRLWHYKIIKLLQKAQLIAQWRELNSIFKKQDKHILINYVYEYHKESLLLYTQYVINEMSRRGYKIKSFDNYYRYFMGYIVDLEDVINEVNPFPDHHTDRYLLQCFYNLQEKYDRGQKDFTKEEYQMLENYVVNTKS